jgi:transcriptional regulator with XRE-family HTH domain
MRGIQVDSYRFRQIRRKRGFTQQELAKLAGVGERTVRNAETGQRVRFDFLKYLAIALAVEVHELTVDDAEVVLAKREARNKAHIIRSLEAFAYERDLRETCTLLAKNAVIRVPGPPAIPFAGEFRGFDGLQRFLDIGTKCFTYERPVEIKEIRANGNLVIMSGIDHIRVTATGKTCSGWWQHVYEYENGRVVRLDNLFDTASTLAAFRLE